MTKRTGKAAAPPAAETIEDYDWNRHVREISVYLDRFKPGDRELVEQFIAWRGTQQETARQLSYSRTTKIYFFLSKLPPGFDRFTDDDITAVINETKQKKWTPNTVRDSIAILKQFSKWMVKKKKNTRLTLEAVDEIRIPTPETREIAAKDLLTTEEINLITEHATPRDKCIIQLMGDGGLRPGEAGTLRRNQLEFADGALYVHVSSKKGGKKERKRRVPAPNAREYILTWLNIAPYHIGENDLLFRSSRFNHRLGMYPPLRSDTLRAAIRGAVRRARADRYKKPYQMRHATISRWLQAGISTAKVAQLSHGGPSRVVEEVYWHPDMEAAGDEVLVKVHGRKEKSEKVVSKPTSRICQVCGRIYPLNVKYCTTCGPLTEEGKVTRDTLMRLIGQAMGEMTPEELQQVQELAGKKE